MHERVVGSIEKWKFSLLSALSPSHCEEVRLRSFNNENNNNNNDSQSAVGKGG